MIAFACCWRADQYPPSNSKPLPQRNSCISDGSADVTGQTMLNHQPHQNDHPAIITMLTRHADAAAISRRIDASRSHAAATHAAIENQGFPCVSNPSLCPFS